MVLFVTARLAREEIHFEDPRGITGTLSRLMVGTPLGCFGIIFLVSGLAVVRFAMWPAIEKKDFSLLTAQECARIAKLCRDGGVWLVRPASCVLRPAAGKDWELYEEHLRRPIPEALKKFYEDPGKILTRLNLSAVELAEESIEFQPLHRDNLVPSRESDLPYDIVPFETTEDQVQIFLMPGDHESNQVVMVDPEGPVLIVPLADSVESFLSSLTLPRPAKPGSR